MLTHCILLYFQTETLAERNSYFIDANVTIITYIDLENQHL